MIIDMLTYYNLIKERNISMIYSGPIWAGGIEEIGGNLKKRLEFDELPLSESLSVFSVFVEQMNNMLMYSAEKDNNSIPDRKLSDISKGMFALGVQGKTYFIQSGNVVKNKSVTLIKSRIDHLNTLDKAELRKFFKEQIKKENTIPDSKGAGLGFIEIARRASSKIEYTFTPLEDGFTFFSMLTSITQGGK